MEAITVRGITLTPVPHHQSTIEGSDGGDTGMSVRCFRQVEPVTPGEPYMASVQVRIEDDGRRHGFVSFQPRTGATPEDAVELALDTYHVSMRHLDPTPAHHELRRHVLNVVTFALDHGDMLLARESLRRLRALVEMPKHERADADTSPADVSHFRAA